MKVEVIARENNLHKKLGIELLTYEEAVKLAFDHIARHEIPSRWTDAMSSKVLQSGISKLTEVPAFGCFKDRREQQLQNEQQTLENIWAIGGENGWYYANCLEKRLQKSTAGNEIIRRQFSSRSTQINK